MGRVGDELGDGEGDVDAHDDGGVDRRQRLGQRRQVLVVDLAAAEDVPQIFEAVEDS